MACTQDCSATCWLCLCITGHWWHSQRSVALRDLCPSSSPLREKERPLRVPAARLPPSFIALATWSFSKAENIWPSTLRAAQVLPFSWIISVSCHKETQEDVSSADCMWQRLLLSQESEAWWINCQLWRMMFSPYFHYEPGCHLLINFMHWYQFIFTSRRSDVFGKGSDSRSGPAWQSWLHLILENYFGSKDRTWPSALKKKKEKK